MIRQAELEDKDKIINFIKENWQQDHIFVKDEFFFDYFYIEKDKINFILGIEENEIKAILGFIKYLDKNNNNIFLALWKSIGNSMLGMQCLEYLTERYQVSSCGINLKTIPIYKFLGFKTGRLKHYYLLNTDRNEFKIAKIDEKKQITFKTKLIENRIIDFNSMKELLENFNYDDLKKYNFFKSKEYFEKIYFNHPYYKYKVIGIGNKNNEITSIIVLREIIINNNKCLRIIDFLGEEKGLKNAENWLKKELIKKNYEYIDFYEVGIKDETLLEIGFIERKENDVNIIPNYFEPFVPKNVEIYYMTSCEENFRMFKGDGDQDRPSLVRE